MAYLLVLDERGEPARSFRIAKGITTIGRADENDVSLDEPSASPYHAHILREGSGYILVSLDPRTAFSVNGEHVGRKTLKDGDEIAIGKARLRFSVRAESPVSDRTAGLDDMKRLYEFSESLMTPRPIEDLLASLMDSIIAVTRAQTGFLILSEGDTFVPKVARNFRKERLNPGLMELSDTVVGRVLREKKPLIVSDALSDEEFRHSESIVNLKLRSVMGVPLRARDRLLGMIYVGNDRASSLFTGHDLEVLTIFAAQAALIVDNAMLVDDLRVRYDGLMRRLDDARFGEVLGSSPAMQKVFRMLDKVAPTEFPVFIIGETGTGKDLLSREIHRRSGRQGTAARIDCAAVSPEALRADLFGSPEKKSKLEEARGGTLVFQEISSLPLFLQAQVLQILDEHRTVRFLATSTRDLGKEKEAGNFREELFYRLGHFIIHLPPLRERAEDVELLARFFLHKITQDLGETIRDFTPGAVSAMLRYPWPGNIMELENKVRRACVMSKGPLLTEEDLEIRTEEFGPLPSLAEAKENFSRTYIEKALRFCHGDKEQAARALGVNVRTIYRYIGKGE